MASQMHVHIKNFKGLRDTTATLHDLNVLIGTNGSGKTSFLELFKFMNLCVHPASTPAYPFSPWWSFENMVWSRDERLPISVHVKYKIDKYNISYKAVVLGVNGRLEFQEELLDVSGYMSIKRNGVNVEYILDNEFKSAHQDAIIKAKHSHKSEKTLFLDKHEVLYLSKLTSMLDILAEPIQFDDKLSIVRIWPMYDNNGDELYIMSPVIADWPLYMQISELFGTTDIRRSGFIFLKNLDYEILYNPVQISKLKSLQENGDGLVNILFEWQMGKKFPSSIKDAIEDLFPGWRIEFSQTEDGRILMRVRDASGTLLNPPSIPDGFYRMLAILVAVELEPRFLLIDELDTSMHARMIEYVLGELQTCDSTVIVTTNSPIVIDSVELEDLLLLEQSEDGVSCRKIAEPDKTRQILCKKGLTTSEQWMYGKI